MWMEGIKYTWSVYEIVFLFFFEISIKVLYALDGFGKYGFFFQSLQLSEGEESSGCEN